MLSALESIAPEAKIPLRDRFCQIECNRINASGVEECSTAYQQFRTDRRPSAFEATCNNVVAPRTFRDAFDKKGGGRLALDSNELALTSAK